MARLEVLGCDVARTEAVRKIASFLDVEPASRMTMVFYPDPESKLLDMGHLGSREARPDARSTQADRRSADDRVRELAAELWPVEELFFGG